MDPLSPKKRLGGDIESPFAEIRKSPKASASATSPYSVPAVSDDDDVLTEEQIEMVRAIIPKLRHQPCLS